ncbi:hypothetical protein EVAR_60580_1 [Eumeta japonica]|uniref:Uncharacterized protein n=1 Tax=Eumeta variegata TaxID=151549 RepID=A0A4C1YHA8_EUMVA|nr:hypothetical protein EVAR_60580_1 [Eumeta japonica]
MKTFGDTQWNSLMSCKESAIAVGGIFYNAKGGTALMLGRHFLQRQTAFSNAKGGTGIFTNAKGGNVRAAQRQGRH